MDICIPARMQEYLVKSWQQSMTTETCIPRVLQESD